MDVNSSLFDELTAAYKVGRQKYDCSWGCSTCFNPIAFLIYREKIKEKERDELWKRLNQLEINYKQSESNILSSNTPNSDWTAVRFTCLDPHPLPSITTSPLIILLVVHLNVSVESDRQYKTLRQPWCRSSAFTQSHTNLIRSLSELLLFVSYGYLYEIKHGLAHFLLDPLTLSVHILNPCVCFPWLEWWRFCMDVRQPKHVLDLSTFAPFVRSFSVGHTHWHWWT